jgi:hypothetical protein
MKHYQFAIADNASRYKLELRDAVDPEPDQPIDDSMNGKLDRLLKIVGEHSSTLAVLRKFVGHYGFGTSDDKPFDDGPDQTEEILHVPGVGPLQSTLVKSPAVGDQGFGYDKKTLNPEIEAYAKKHGLEGVSK